MEFLKCGVFKKEFPAKKILRKKELDVETFLRKKNASHRIRHVRFVEPIKRQTDVSMSRVRKTTVQR